LEVIGNRPPPVACSNDERQLPSCSHDGTVPIWDAETGALQEKLEIGTSLWPLCKMDGVEDIILIQKYEFRFIFEHIDVLFEFCKVFMKF